jgi:hypothetical protein
MNTALLFKEFFEASFKVENDPQMASLRSDEFFTDVIHSAPVKLEILESYLLVGNFDLFYKSLTDFKYLIEFSDNLSRYWHLLRGYSEAMGRLKTNQSVKGSKRLYFEYFEKYGDRRSLRDEYWFESKRWEFLDELLGIYYEEDLRIFILKYQQRMIENLKIYESIIVLFVSDLQKIQSDSLGLKMNK